MGFRVDGSKALFADVGVALRRGDIAVAKKILYHAKVCPTIEQVGCEAVTQSVWMGRPLAAAVDDAPNVARGQTHTALVAEQRRPGLGGDHITTSPQPDQQSVDGRGAERHPSLFATFAPHGDRTSGKIQGIDVEAAQLTDAYTTAVQNLEHRIIAATTPRGLSLAVDVVGRVEKRRDLAVLQNTWQPGRPSRSAQRHRRVDLDIAPVAKERVVTTKRRNLAGDSSFGEFPSREGRHISPQHQTVHIDR
ncbi:MAG: hypothetical protein QOE09_2438 [Ilumatobacteraceae bacterium]